MQTLHWLLQLSRPRFWMYVFGPFLVGLAAGWQQTDGMWENPLLLVFLGLFFMFPANLLIYGVNDLFDYETDKLNPKKKDYETLLEPHNRHRFYSYLLGITLPFIVLISVWLVALDLSVALLALLAFLFFGIGYSAPPIRAKVRPFFDSFFNVLYIFSGVMAYSVLTDSWPALHILIAATLWTMAMHAFSAIPDISSDKKAGIATIATKLNKQNTIIFCAVAYMLSAALVFREIGMLAAVASVVYVTLMILSFRARTAKELFDIYRLFPYVNVTVGFVLFWYTIIAF